MSEVKKMTIEEFKEYVFSLNQEGYSIEEKDDTHILFNTDYAIGQIVFYPQDIIELIITSTSENENLFYLHFQLNDANHAKDLVNEMVQSLIHLKDKQNLRVLMTCTSGVTTSYFVSLLNEAAQRLKLEYEFHACDYNRIYKEGFDYDVILLAPQVHYEYDRIKEIFKHQLVLKIPASVFAQYSAGHLIQLIIEERNRPKETQEFSGVLRNVFDNKYRILSIVVINHKNQIRLGYCIFDHGKKTLDKEVIKPNQSFSDITDLLDYVLARHKDIDAIGIALPGITNRGYVYHPTYGFSNDSNIGNFLTITYKKPVMLINDVNAVALGYHAINENSENMVFYFQPRGIAGGGAGIVIDGKLYRGWKSAAGEMRSLTQKQIENADEKILEPKGAMEIVTNVLLSYIATMAPEKIVLYSELTPDVNDIKENLKNYISEEYIPEIIHVSNLKEYMLSGAMIHSLEVLNNDPMMYQSDIDDSNTFANLVKNIQ